MTDRMRTRRDLDTPPKLHEAAIAAMHQHSQRMAVHEKALAVAPEDKREALAAYKEVSLLLSDHCDALVALAVEHDIKETLT